MKVLVKRKKNSAKNAPLLRLVRSIVLMGLCVSIHTNGIYIIKANMAYVWQECMPASFRISFVLG